jgi:hypothetical protein
MLNNRRYPASAGAKDRGIGKAEVRIKTGLRPQSASLSMG